MLLTKLFWVVDASFFISKTIVVPSFGIVWVDLGSFSAIAHYLLIVLSDFLVVHLVEMRPFVGLESFDLPGAKFDIASWKQGRLNIKVLFNKFLKLVCRLLLQLRVVDIVGISSIVDG